MLRFRTSLIVAVTVLTLAAGCADEPSGLGLGLVDAQAGEPQAITLESTAFELDDDADITSGYLTVDIAQGYVPAGTHRFLAGRVDDPDLGTIVATGNWDFVPLNGVNDDFRLGTVASVTLSLVPNYVYGDTLSPVTLALSEIISAWDAAGVHSDSTLTSSSPIVETTFSPTDTLVVIEMPAGWIDTNDALLRSDSFTEDFEGFQLSAVSGGAVVGFRGDASFVSVAVPGDTLLLGIDEMLTSVDRSGAQPAPSGLFLLQDGLDVGSVEIDLSVEELINASVHNAIFRVQTASPDLSEPVDFFRPSLGSLDLVAITGEEESRVLLGNSEIDDQGRLSFSTNELSVAMQNTTRGIGEFVRFELAAPIELNSLDYVFFQRLPSGGGPRIILTVTEVN